MIAILFCALASAGIASRVGLHDGGIEVLTEDSDASCNADTCEVQVGATCYCDQFLGSADLKARAERNLFSTLQRLRFLADTLHPEASSFAKLWHDGEIPKAENNLEFMDWIAESPQKESLQGSIIVDEMDTPVKSAIVRSMKLPAGVMPIMVEIWDKGVVANTFVGETGEMLSIGDGKLSEREYTKALENNGNRHKPRLGRLGTVTFKISTEKDPPEACSFNRQINCTRISVIVTCLRANNLLNVDSGIMGDVTDPYCKIRVKTDPSKTSTKFATEAITNNLNPDFSSMGPFGTQSVHVWEAPLVEGAESWREPVPWIFEELTLTEQAHANAWLLASNLLGDKCKAPGYDSKLKAVCKSIETFSSPFFDE